MRTQSMSAIVLCAAALLAADIAGEWRIAQPGNTLVCTFARNGGALAGNCGPASGPDGVSIEGTVSGRHVVWTFQIALDPKGKKQPVTYTGTLDASGNKMRGTFSIANRHGAFRGVRQ